MSNKSKGVATTTPNNVVIPMSDRLSNNILKTNVMSRPSSIIDGDYNNCALGTSVFINSDVERYNIVEGTYTLEHVIEPMQLTIWLYEPNGLIVTADIGQNPADKLEMLMGNS